MNIDFAHITSKYTDSNTKKIKNTYRSKRRSSSFISISLTSPGAKQSSPMLKVLESHVTYPLILPPNMLWYSDFVNGFGLILGSKMYKFSFPDSFNIGTTWNPHVTTFPSRTLSVSWTNSPKMKCFFGRSNFFLGNLFLRCLVRYFEKRWARYWHPRV